MAVVRRFHPAWSIAAVLTATLAGSFAPIGAEEERIPPKQEATALAAQAKAAAEAGRYHEAQDLYRKSLALSSDEGVAKSLAIVDMVLSGSADDAATSREGVRDQLAQVEAKTCIDKAELLAQGGKFEAAQQQLAIARRLLTPLKDVADATETLKSIARLDQEYAEQSRVARLEAAAKSRNFSRIDAEQKALEQEERRQSVFSERVARIESLKRRQLYELALSNCRTLVRDFADDPRAEKLFQEVLAAAHEQRKLSRIESDKELEQEVLARIERALIPTGFDGLPDYPIDWLLRHEHTRSVLDEQIKLPEWQEHLKDRLAQRINFQFDDTDLIEALTYLSKRGGFSLVIDPSLYASEHRVSILPADMRIDSALNWVCRQCQTNWELYNQAVYVGGKIENKPVWAIYDVSDLVLPVYDQPGKILAYASTYGGVGNAGGTGGGGYVDPADANNTNNAISPEDFVDLLKNVISPQTWTDAGNEILISGNTLYVTAPTNVHLLVREFIRSQSKARNILVHIDARWLQIDDNFMEEIGVNWGAQAAMLRYPGTTTLQPGYNKQTQVNHFRGDVINTLPATAAQLDPLSPGSGLQVWAMRLGANQAAAIFSAVERKNRVRDVAEISLATFNGVRSNAFFGHQIGYVGDYQISSGGLDPGVNVLNVGSSLDIRPWVSSDRKYVTVEMRHSRTLVMFQRENISQIPSVGTASTQPYPIELSNVQVAAAATQVIFPDKGTLLIGGFGAYSEENTYAMVPFLGHIPWLGRLFGKRGRYSQRGHLYLLATANIIIYDEEEAKL